MISKLQVFDLCICHRVGYRVALTHITNG